MRKVYCFPPISAPDAKILILGTMPGAASLEAGEYYAHPRNQFWPIMQKLFDAEGPLSYEEKQALLLENRIALWDVFEACVRKGSLDSAIRHEVLNDFPGFFDAHPFVRAVFFDSGTAEKAFLKHVIPLLNQDKFEFHRLPSPSPAHAARTFEEKVRAWQKIHDFLS